LKKYLFFFVHPSKYHLYKSIINFLLKEGHHVKVIIISKDILEDLVKQESWDYENIFPEGRRSKSNSFLGIVTSTILNFFKTIIRLHNITKKDKYDLFITDDCLSINGFLRKTPVLYFQDDDLKVVPESKILLFFATKIFAPNCTDLGKFNNKKVGFLSYKELAYLHPSVFTPNEAILNKYGLKSHNFVLIRLVSLTASHDIGKQGINDDRLHEIIYLIKQKGLVPLISSERNYREEFNQYCIKILPQDFVHVLAYSKLFIGDSQTTASEAAVLGVPGIRFNDFVGKISIMEEKETKFDLYYGFKTNQFDAMLQKVNVLLDEDCLNEKWLEKRNKMLHTVEDINEKLIKTINTF
jgi:predicted glycosyltransferase